MKALETDKRNFLFIAGVLFLGLTLIIGSSMAYAKSAQEINISVDVTLEQFRQDIKGGKEFLKSSKGVLVFPSVIKAGYVIGGEYGEGILSKWSFVSTRNVPLPFTPGNEPRAAVEVLTVIPSGDTIAFVGTHFDHTRNQADRLSQANKVNEVFTQNKYPTILAGDLNAVPESETMQILKQVWTVTDTKKEPSPTLQVIFQISKILT